MYETTTQPKGTKPKTRVWAYTKEQIGTLPAIISKEEVSHIVGVSTRTVTRLANDNRIHGAFRVGIQWRFNTDEVCRQFRILR